ncbi:1-acyl-sn-glycerol-3-phosphate acyltransferase [candidate division GN15 bacterium]|nr:1-acyl-sn-glycerol-3-phosphate acyltransferase [candidate division GN15 bacterium]
MKILYWLGWTLTRVLGTVLFRVRVRGRENIPKSGGFIMASNHISWYDPPLVGSFQRRELYFFAKRELFQNRLFGAIIEATNALPVARGKVDRKSLHMSLNVVKQGFGLTFFPEGTRAPKGRFLPARAGLGLLAAKAKVPIVPVYIHGSNDLKACFWGRDRMSITYGEPLSVEWQQQFAAGKEGYQALADGVMARIAGMKEHLLAGPEERKQIADQ